MSIHIQTGRGVKRGHQFSHGGIETYGFSQPQGGTGQSHTLRSGDVLAGVAAAVPKRTRGGTNGAGRSAADDFFESRRGAIRGDEIELIIDGHDAAAFEISHLTLGDFLQLAGRRVDSAMLLKVLRASRPRWRQRW
jgi:ethanolamine ammonia-lyase large subunit